MNSIYVVPVVVNDDQNNVVGTVTAITEIGDILCSIKDLNQIFTRSTETLESCPPQHIYTFDFSKIDYVTEELKKLGFNVVILDHKEVKIPNLNTRHHSRFLSKFFNSLLPMIVFLFGVYVYQKIYS
ncbi:hypothetical protein Catovirus_1_435 [Catovirus CTV1]|uniref:Uncharacterized protein n=1 Tax=Catovirus CTV1 TaxID=1977631 RepID=A0A1V0S9J4_9VIRU|nr:hypothetical protein Catovirus_1_435 [Catovirus CTV1]